MTQARIDGAKLHIPCEIIDGQIDEWLTGVTVDPQLLPAIRQVYRTQIARVTETDRVDKAAELRRRMSQLKEEESKLGRLYITSKITEDSYDQLRSEWLEKVRHAEHALSNLERDTARYLDDLDLAVILLANLCPLYDRLGEEHRARLLQILTKRIIVNREGEIINHELHSPFLYLSQLTTDLRTLSSIETGSEQLRLGEPKRMCDEPVSSEIKVVVRCVLQFLMDECSFGT